MRECLRLADNGSKKTIAFSAMGSGGFLGYPRDIVACIMYGAIVEFDNSYSTTSLRDISIVINAKETETVKVCSLFSLTFLSSLFVKNKLMYILILMYMQCSA